jgi:thymidine kinase
MKIIELDKPKIKSVKMLVDGVIDEKLTEYEMIDCCWARTSFNILIGSMGSGKTTLMINLMRNVFNKCFTHIYVIMPPQSRASVKDNWLEKNIPSQYFKDEISVEILQDILKELKDNTKNKEFSMVVIDDMGSDLKNKFIVKQLQKMILSMRHLRCSFWLLQQNFQQLAKPLRELATNFITYDIGKSQLEKLFNESVQLEKDKFLELTDLAFDKPHEWICLNTKTKRFFKGFDEIELNDEEKI